MTTTIKIKTNVIKNEMKNEKGNLGREQRKEPGYEVVINAAILGRFIHA